MPFVSRIHPATVMGVEMKIVAWVLGEIKRHFGHCLLLNCVNGTRKMNISAFFEAYLLYLYPNFWAVFYGPSDCLLMLIFIC